MRFDTAIGRIKQKFVHRNGPEQSSKARSPKMITKAHLGSGGSVEGGIAQSNLESLLNLATREDKGQRSSSDQRQFSQIANYLDREKNHCTQYKTHVTIVIWNTETFRNDWASESLKTSKQANIDEPIEALSNLRKLIAHFDDM
jgi:Asp-tRNA(Asn)/Glu-tRNA(Gln) amidotransferase C subunit